MAAELPGQNVYVQKPTRESYERIDTGYWCQIKAVEQLFTSAFKVSLKRNRKDLPCKSANRFMSTRVKENSALASHYITNCADRQYQIHIYLLRLKLEENGKNGASKTTYGIGGYWRWPPMPQVSLSLSIFPTCTIISLKAANGEEWTAFYAGCSHYLGSNAVWYAAKRQTRAFENQPSVHVLPFGHTWFVVCRLRTRTDAVDVKAKPQKRDAFPDATVDTRRRMSPGAEDEEPWRRRRRIWEGKQADTMGVECRGESKTRATFD